jgi:hypothetical protein
MRTDLFVQIASPIEGSLKAFFTLKKHPVFDPIFDRKWQRAHRKDPGKRAHLLQVLGRFSSLYQLLT